MQPINRIYLHEDGNCENRIGPNVRNPAISDSQNIEHLLNDLCPLALTCDVSSIHPPYFYEFSYHDMLGGICVTTLSAEITARVAAVAARLPARYEFPVDEAIDKYVLNKPEKKHRKVVFLAGGNATNLLDQSALQRLMMDDEWVIKLHPVTQTEMIRDLAALYGYHRLIEPEVSGMALLNEAEEVAAMSTSELFLLARLMDKPVVDLTRFDRAWLTTYGHITRLLDGSDNDRVVINNVLMSDLSGHLRDSYGEKRNRELAENYYAAAMEEREKFRMVTNQRIQVADKTIIDWK